MKINFIKDEHEMKLEEISSEICRIAFTGRNNEAKLDFYEKLMRAWEIIDETLAEQYALKQILPF